MITNDDIRQAASKLTAAQETLKSLSEQVPVRAVPVRQAAEAQDWPLYSVLFKDFQKLLGQQHAAYVAVQEADKELKYTLYTYLRENGFSPALPA